MINAVITTYFSSRAMLNKNHLLQIIELPSNGDVFTSIHSDDL